MKLKIKKIDYKFWSIGGWNFAAQIQREFDNRKYDQWADWNWRKKEPRWPIVFWKRSLISDFRRMSRMLKLINLKKKFNWLIKDYHHKSDQSIY